MDSQAKYLLSLRAIRERAKLVEEVARSGDLSHFELREDKLDDAADFVASVIKVAPLPPPPPVAFPQGDSPETNRCSVSVTTARTSSTPSLPTGAGSTLRPAMCRASPT